MSGLELHMSMDRHLYDLFCLTVIKSKDKGQRAVCAYRLEEKAVSKLDIFIRMS